MVMEIICHMGLHKTGTSAIQNALRSAKLPKGSVFWKGANRLHHYVCEPTTEKYTEFKSELKKFQDDGVSRLILSSEYFSGDPWKGYSNRQEIINALGSFFGEHDVTPIIFVRRQDELLESLWRQHVKQGGEEQLDYFLSNDLLLSNLKYQDLAQMVSNAFNKRPKISIYHPLKNSLSDFSSMAKIPERVIIEKHQVRVNPTWPPEFVSLMRYLNTEGNVNRKSCRTMFDRLAEKIEPAVERSTALHQESKKNIQKIFEHANREFMANYLVGSSDSSLLQWGDLPEKQKVSRVMDFPTINPSLSSSIHYLLVQASNDRKPGTNRLLPRAKTVYRRIIEYLKIKNNDS